MARRKKDETPAAAEVDAEVAIRRFRQLARRLRLSFELESEPYERVKRKIADAAAIDDPHARLERLLDIADELRPLLPDAGRQHTLPAYDWRTR